MKVTLEFDTRDVFDERTRSVMDELFSGKIRSDQACKKLGWPRAVWARTMAGLVSFCLTRKNLKGA